MFDVPVLGIVNHHRPVIRRLDEGQLFALHPLNAAKSHEMGIANHSQHSMAGISHAG